MMPRVRKPVRRAAENRRRQVKMKTTRVYTRVLVPLVLTAILVVQSSGLAAADFRLDPPAQDELDLNSMSPGRVTVRAYIGESGDVYRTAILVESLRSGPAEMWEYVSGIVDSWNYTGGAVDPGAGPNYLDFTVVKPGRGEGRPRIEISARAMTSLREGYQLPHDRPSRLVAARGINAGRIELTEIPPSMGKPAGKGIGEIVYTIWHNMDHYEHLFQYVFGVIFLLFLWFLYSAIKSSMSAWSPGDSRLAGIIPFTDVNQMFGGKVADARARWVSIILKTGAADPQKEQIRQFVAGLREGRELSAGEIIRKAVDYPFVKEVLGKSVDVERLAASSGNDITGQEEKRVRVEVDDMKDFADICTGPDSRGEWHDYARPRIKEIISGIADRRFDLFEILKAGLHNHLINQNNWWASQEIDRAIDRVIVTKVDRRNRIVDKLWTIGSISPLVGLFGTVVGISTAFGKLGGLHSQSKIISELSGEINVALSTTIVGLVLGILSFTMYYLFKNTISKKAASIENFIVDITNEA
ncbi:MAG: hypothetical protein GF417_10175 [Candidatus Latescibacteria bacterium]|nr:hypothetical protein [bacterium]MBD3424793.1 hypothetical protein [Candidatus Latescibacterota bacterium]